MVDVDEESAQYIRSKTRSEIRTVTHVSNLFPLLSNTQRLAYAEKFLNTYAQAKCVVTTRLHAAMPCLGLQTPVLLIVRKSNSRFFGLRELTWNCEREELLQGLVDFDFDNPPENPKYYLPLRENIIQTVTKWVKDNS